jgi:hypothetical protein
VIDMEPLIDDDRASLLSLVAALDASPRALRRHECGDWQVTSKHGHVYVDGDGYLIAVSTGESARRWGNVKRSLPFCKVKQDGDDEGCLRLDRPPAPHEAIAIRDAIGIRKRRHVAEETRAALVSRLSQNRYNLASHGSGIVQNGSAGTWVAPNTRIKPKRPFIGGASIPQRRFKCHFSSAKAKN